MCVGVNVIMCDGVIVSVSVIVAAPLCVSQSVSLSVASLYS